MKRVLCLLLAVLLLLGCVSVAQAKDTRVSKRHSTRFIVDKSAGYSHGTGDVASGAQVNTDGYIQVFDWESDVYIHVINRQRKAIPGAAIYLTSFGTTQYYGLSDANGEMVLHLNRDQWISYLVTKVGYKDGEGRFYLDQKTNHIYIILDREVKIHAFVYDSQSSRIPQKGLDVCISGTWLKTNESGHAFKVSGDGTYPVTLQLPDGQQLTKTAVVKGEDVTVVFYLTEFIQGQDPDPTPTPTPDPNSPTPDPNNPDPDYPTPDPENPDPDPDYPNPYNSDGSTKDYVIPASFLVFNKNYTPEDYSLIGMMYKATDLTKNSDETEAQFAQRQERYLESHPNTIYVSSLYEDQYEGLEDGVAVQRSMMPTGRLVRAWNIIGAKKVVFRNDEAAIAFDLDKLYTGDAAKAIAVLDAIAKNDLTMSNILKTEYVNDESILKSSGLDAIDDTYESTFEGVDLSVVQDVAFAFTRSDESQYKILSNMSLDNVTFEFRITPVSKETLERMLFDELGSKGEDYKELVLINDDQSITKLRNTLNDGLLSNGEKSALLSLLLDGQLSEDEIKELRKQHVSGKLTNKTVNELIDNVLAGHVYRVSTWVLYAQHKANISKLIPGTAVMYCTDDMTDEEVDALSSEGMLLVDEDCIYRKKQDKKDAVKVDFTSFSFLDDENSEFYDVLKNKTFSGYKEYIRTIFCTGDNYDYIDYRGDIIPSTFAYPNEKWIRYGEQLHNGLVTLYKK